MRYVYVCVCVLRESYAVEEDKKKIRHGVRLYSGSALYARTKTLEKGVAIVASPSIRQHTSAYDSIRQHVSLLQL